MTLALNTANVPFLHVTLQFMMMHHQTKFIYKRLSGLEDIWTKSGHTDTVQTDGQRLQYIPPYTHPHCHTPSSKRRSRGYKDRMLLNA